MARTIEQLSAFVESVETGGFKAASRQIGKHAVTISGLVAKLESELGFELFIRKPRSLELTEEGKELYSYAKSALHELEFFDAKADSLLAGQPSRLTLAIDPSISSPALIGIYNRLSKTFPSLAIKILTGDPLFVRSLVLSGQADVGFSMATRIAPQEISTADGFSFEVCLIANPELDIFSTQLQNTQLRRIPQVSLNFFKEIGLSAIHELSHRVTHCSDMHEIISIVEGCECWAAAPKYLAKSKIQSGKLKEFTLEGQRPADWHTELSWRAEKPINEAMQLFIEQVKLLPNC
ncbi:LysR family transcriptional regulator [Agarivorans aestuarii]|uniref:LysR family transcriptional regulator n=1 Tax=Agarivorans aestuarii TaxID=1563703 RepID=A0ABU7G6S1_9ALTE|nr:LysR family transcriptional regulator [Agarivorans aestuarii]MEE1674936.1 LysR family transcriptional regulator [Agarivorans aestuarii]